MKSEAKIINCISPHSLQDVFFGRYHPEIIGIQQDESVLQVSLKNETRTLRALHGLYRTLINNMISIPFIILKV